MTPFFRILLFLIALLAGTASVADELRTFELKYRSAEELMPLVRPLLGDGASLSGRGSILLIRASKAALKDAADIIERLDTLPKQLLITVQQGDSGALDRQGFEVTTRDGIRLYSDRQRNDARAVQHLRTLEGHWARIETGDAVPLPRRSATVTPGGVVVREGVEYRQFDSGFEVQPRIAGKRVILSVRPFREKPTGHGGRYETSEMVTTVEGALGEWIEIGGGQENRRGSESGLIYHGAGKEKTENRTRLKVELIQ